jgi:predicted transcriptional regulator
MYIAEVSSHRWTFLTNHTHVLICILRNPDMRMREVAQIVGITERAVQRIVNELAEEGYVEIRKEGRRNMYVPHLEQPLRHPIEANKSIGQMLKFLDLSDANFS